MATTLLLLPTSHAHSQLQRTMRERLIDFISCKISPNSPHGREWARSTFPESLVKTHQLAKKLFQEPDITLANFLCRCASLGRCALAAGWRFVGCSSPPPLPCRHPSPFVAPHSSSPHRIAPSQPSLANANSSCSEISCALRLWKGQAIVMAIWPFLRRNLQFLFSVIWDVNRLQRNRDL